MFAQMNNRTSVHTRMLPSVAVVNGVLVVCCITMVVGILPGLLEASDGWRKMLDVYYRSLDGIAAAQASADISE